MRASYNAQVSVITAPPLPPAPRVLSHMECLPHSTSTSSNSPTSRLSSPKSSTAGSPPVTPHHTAATPRACSGLELSVAPGSALPHLGLSGAGEEHGPLLSHVGAALAATPPDPPMWVNLLKWAAFTETVGTGRELVNIPGDRREQTRPDPCVVTGSRRPGLIADTPRGHHVETSEHRETDGSQGPSCPVCHTERWDVPKRLVAQASILCINSPDMSCSSYLLLLLFESFILSEQR